MGPTLCLEGISKDGLIIINEGKPPGDFALGAASSIETTELWHRRFGHLGYDNLYKLQSKGMVNGISVAASQFKEHQQHGVCEPCKATQAAISNFRHHKHKAIATHTHGCVWTLGGDLQRRSKVLSYFLG